MSIGATIMPSSPSLSSDHTASTDMNMMSSINETSNTSGLIMHIIQYLDAEQEPSATHLHHYDKKEILELLHLRHLPTVSYSLHEQEYSSYVQHLTQQLPPTSAFSLLCRNPQRFERVTRITIPEFYILFSEIDPYISRPYSHSEDVITLSHSRSIPNIDQLLMWIIRSEGNDADLVGILFNDIHRTTVDRIADHVTQAVLDCWSVEIEWPDVEQRQSLYGLLSTYDKAVGIMDGSHCQIRVPTYDEYEYYSGYKEYHTQNYLICVDALGLVIYLNGPYAGRKNDRSAFNETPFVKEMCDLLSDGEIILADGGFAGPGHVLHQFTANDMKGTDNDQKTQMQLFTEDFILNRSLIEHCIHRVKNRVKALQKRFSRALRKQDELVRAACCVYNRHRRLRIEYQLKIAGK